MRSVVKTDMRWTWGLPKRSLRGAQEFLKPALNTWVILSLDIPTVLTKWYYPYFTISRISIDSGLRPSPVHTKMQHNSSVWNGASHQSVPITWLKCTFHKCLTVQAGRVIHANRSVSFWVLFQDTDKCIAIVTRCQLGPVHPQLHLHAHWSIRPGNGKPRINRGCSGITVSLFLSWLPLERNARIPVYLTIAVLLPCWSCNRLGVREGS